MTRRPDDPATANAARAVERVLRAERDAEAGVEQAGRDAEAIAAAARDEALVIVNRAIEHIARWQPTHAAAVQRRLDRLRARAEAAVAPAPDAATLRAAVDQVAALLTGAGAHADDDATR